MIDKDDEVIFDKFLELEINKKIKNHKFKQPSKLKNINILKKFKILVENSINEIKKQHSKKLIKVTTNKNYSLITDYIWIIQEFVDNNQTKEMLYCYYKFMILKEIYNTLFLKDLLNFINDQIYKLEQALL